MKQFEETNTEENLRAALAGESQASVKYKFFAEKAREEGYEQIGAIFDETSHNEEEHAKIWYQMLNGMIGDTTENLQNCVNGEHYEWTTMYKNFAADARADGFDQLAELFEKVASIENSHEERFQKLLDNVDDGTVFKRDEDKKWLCRNCGYIHEGKEAPEICPVCNYPQGFYEIKPENY